VAKIDAVVFDIGNVLVCWEPEQFYDRTIGAERRKNLFADVDLYEMNARVDLGADFRATVYDTGRKNPEWQAEIRMWHDRWIEMAQPEITHSRALLRALKARAVPVFALSNFGTGSLEVAKSAYPVLREFDRAYISGHMGVAKPDAEIYRRLEEDSGVAPGGLLFADDRPENITAAAARGWQTHHFSDPQGFADRLVAEGLLSEKEAGP